MYLDWKTDPRDYIVFDIEGDDYNATVIWCMCWFNLKTRQKGQCIGHAEIRAFFDANPTAVFIGHYILGFDIPTCNRLVGTRIPVSRCIDTLILSTLYSPSLAGGHSIESWGERFKKPKIVFKDFSRLTEEMIKYCHRDVLISAEIFVRLTATLKSIGFSEKSIYIQHHFSNIMRNQQKAGFYFNAKKAGQLYGLLRTAELNLTENIYHAFPPELQLLRTYKQAYRRDGSHTANYDKHLKLYEEIRLTDEGQYEAYGRVPFNLGSADQRVAKLLELGWEPREFTKSGNPQPFRKGDLSESLQEFVDANPKPEVEMIARWMAYNGRANMIRDWINNWNENDNCIHGRVDVADTLRLRHSKPNSANVPAPRHRGEELLLGADGYFTYEARDCWTARPNRLLVGTDAAGLEFRMLAHYINNPEFTHHVIDGDIHGYNQEKAGLPTRNNAKTFIYAFLYGAGDKKIGSIVGGTARRGKELKETFSRDVEGLSDVLSVCEREYRNGRISLVDGSKIVCPSNHAALNYKLQGGGARVMAQGAIFLNQYIRAAGLDSIKVGDIHDEWQFDVLPRDADEHARLADKALVDAGEELNLNVPIFGKSKKGLTWAETH